MGLLPETVSAQIAALSITQLELIGEALLDFTQVQEIVDWLANHHNK